MTWAKLKAHADLLKRPIPTRESYSEAITAYVRDWAHELLVEEEASKVTLTPEKWRWLRERLDDLNRKAVKLGLEVGAGYRVIGETFHPLLDDPRKGHLQIDVAISGPSLRWEGWTFVGGKEIEDRGPEGGGRVTSRFAYPGSEATGEVYDQLMSRPIWCDHCCLKRDRVISFLVGHEDGRLVEVGSACVKDFMGHEYPVRLAAIAGDMARWKSWQEEKSAKPPEPLWGWETYMAHVVEAVTRSQIGYRPYYGRGWDTGYSTAHAAWRMMVGEPSATRKWEPSTESAGLAKEIILWAHENSSALGYPISRLLLKPYLDKEDSTQAASLYPIYMRQASYSQPGPALEPAEEASYVPPKTAVSPAEDAKPFLDWMRSQGMSVG